MTRSVPFALFAAALAACSDAPSPLEPTAAALATPVASAAAPIASLVTSQTWHDILPVPANFANAHIEVKAINAAGWVVGTTFGDYNQVTWQQTNRATLWKGTTAINLGNFHPDLPSRGTWAHDVNDAGVVVGYGMLSNAQGTSLAYRAFRWTEGEGIALLPNLPGIVGRTVAEAVNAQGHIVGYSDVGGERHVVLWTDPAQPPVDLGAFGGTWAEGVDVNDAGQIAGFAFVGGQTRSFLRQPDGTVHLVPEPNARVRGMNADGVLVGVVTPPDGTHRAFRWSLADGFAYLAAPAGSVTGNSAANGINAQGHVVGLVEHVEPDGVTTYWRAAYHADGTWFDLGAAVEPASTAEEVNASGQVAGGPIAPTWDRDRGVRWTVALVEEAPRFTFTGFFAPVDSAPAVNRVKAGSAIPVKFSLGGDHGLDVLAAGYPLSQPIACDAGAPALPVEETTTAGSSGLRYDAAADQYVYAWKTQKAWAGTCRRLVVRLVDGTEKHADFAFTK